MCCVLCLLCYRFAPEVRSVTEMSVSDHVIIAMACCHSLTIVDGEIIGDPMDMKMFEATHWVGWLCLNSVALAACIGS